jgi:type VI secretion system protein VasD
MAFAAGDAEKDGITIGAHAFALSDGSGAHPGGSASVGQPLAPVRCQ